MRWYWFIVLFVLLTSGCAVGKNYSPSKEYAPEALRSDFRLFRKILEANHPSLYWYTPKDSIDRYFAYAEGQIRDSMPEYKFRNLLSYTLAKIKCGHTTVKPSKAAMRYARRTRSISFPLNVKAWDDTLVVTSNLTRRDSSITRGAIIRKIDGRPVTEIIDSLFAYLSADGYNITHKYQTLSNTGVFRALYSTVYGLSAKTTIEYVDTSGAFHIGQVDYYDPASDTGRLHFIIPMLNKRERKKQERLAMRNLRIDSALNTAFMEVNSFSKGSRLRRFFRQSFRTMAKQQVGNLVVDMRGNGGGSVILSNLLTKYIASKPFKIADSLYALQRSSSYGKYVQGNFWNNLFMLFMTHRRADGHYHFTAFERKYFKPRTHHHFNGPVYVLTGGNTFSAASLFTKAIADQPNVLVVGEETGGGGYGNTAWLIPDVTLPQTGVRFRLPLFRLVIDRNALPGRGIIPKVEVRPTVKDIRRNADFKMEKVVELIWERKEYGITRRGRS